MKIPPAKWKFEIYLARRSSPEYVMVYVHKDYRSLQLHRKDKQGGCEAFFRSTDISEIIKIAPGGDETRVVNNCFGEVHFYPGSLSVGIIAHEMFHVVTMWAWEHGCIPSGNEPGRKKSTVFDIPTNEELCAEMIGELVGQMIVGLSKVMKKEFLIHKD